MREPSSPFGPDRLPSGRGEAGPGIWLRAAWLLVGWCGSLVVLYGLWVAVSYLNHAA